MASPYENPETGRRAVLEAPPAAGRRLTREQQAVKQVQEDLSKNGARAALENAARPKPAIERGKVDTLVDQNIGTEIDLTTGDKVRPPGSEEERRFNEARNSSELTLKMLERGFDRLSVPEQVNVVAQVERAIMAWPEVNAVFRTPAERQMAIARLLREPNALSKIREVFSQATSPDKLLKAERVNELQGQFDVIANQERVLNAKDIQAARDYTDAGSLLDQFKTTPPGPKYTELQNLERDIATADIPSKRDELDNVKGNIQRLVNLERAGRAPADVVDQLRDLAIEEARIKRDLRNAETNIVRKQSLEKEKTDLEEKRKTIEQQRDELRVQLSTALDQRNRIQIALVSERNKRDTEEEEFVDGVKNVISEGMMQYLEDKINEANKLQMELLDKEAQDSSDKAEKVMLDTINSRWWRDGRDWRGRPRKELDRANVNSDYTALMANGPDQVMRDMLAGKLTPAEINQKMNEPKFIETMQPKVLESLISNRIQTGRVSDGDARFILSTTWGAEVFNKALAKNASARDQLAKLRNEGVIRGSAVDWAKRLN